MRAIVIVHGAPEDPTLADQYTTPLLPLVDRPFLLHVVDYLVASGIESFDFLLCRLPEKVECLLGNGSDWGCDFRFHRAVDERQLYSLLPCQASNEENILLVHADRLPETDLSMVAAQSSERSAPILLSTREGWLGWAILHGAFLNDASLVSSEITLERWLRSFPRRAQIFVGSYLESRSFAGLINAQAQVAMGMFPRRIEVAAFSRPYLSPQDLLEQSDNAISLGHGAFVHPTARLIGPVYVGEFSQIGAGACIGPNAVIGANVVVGECASVKDALILPSASIGQGQEIANGVANPRHLWHIRRIPAKMPLDIAEPAPERSWAGNRGMAGKVASRLTAMLCLMILWPVLALTALALLLFRNGPLTYRHALVSLPTTLNEQEWQETAFWSFAAEPRTLHGIRHFLLHMLPGLIAVAQGKLRFVGVQPRSRQATLDLPANFRSVYLSSKPGLLQNVRVSREMSAMALEGPQISEATYAASASLRTDLKVLWRYLQGKVR